MGSVDSNIPGPFDVKSVAILGAGPSGLAAAKYLLAQPAAASSSSSDNTSSSHFTKITIFEQQPQVGGVWLYSASPAAGGKTPIPQTSPFSPPDEPLVPGQDDEDDGQGKKKPIFPSPMYERLHTNIPHTLMQYGDAPFRDAQDRTVEQGGDMRIFPEREVVQRYLEEYAAGVRHLIRFSTSVLSVKLRQVEENSISGNGKTKKDQWDIRSQNLLTGHEETETYDAVVVANGHYRTTYVPDIQGIAAFNEKYPGTISHSKTYRTPEAFRGKKVLLVGNSASGLDIASQITKVCEPPLLVSVRTNTPDDVRRHVGFEEVAEIERFLPDDEGDRAVLLKDGRKVTDLDTVLFCTGYLFTFPFFDVRDFSERGGRPLITDGRKVHGLYRDLLHIRHPTLAFPGLPIKVIPFPFAEAQAAVFSRAWANALRLPPVAEMEAWEVREEDTRTPGKYHVYPALGDAKYINAMHDWVGREDAGAGKKGKEPPWWDEEMFWRRGIYAQAKMRFEQGGKKARTLEELGFVYEPERKEKEEVIREARNDEPGLDVAA